MIVFSDSSRIFFCRHWNKYRRIYYILSRWENWPWKTCYRTSCPIKCRKWIQCSMNYGNSFIKFQDINSWTFEQWYRYSSRWISSKLYWIESLLYAWIRMLRVPSILGTLLEEYILWEIVRNEKLTRLTSVREVCHRKTLKLRMLGRMI